MNAHFNGRKPGAQRASRRRVAAALRSASAAIVLAAQSGFAQTNLTSASVTPELPDSATGLFSLLRVLGALALVFAIFFGGLWLFRNWQRVMVNKGRAPKLDVLEVKSLGQRHALYVVGYESQRMLIASSPAGITMLTGLPDAELAEPASPTVANGSHDKPRFADAIKLALQRR